MKIFRTMLCVIGIATLAGCSSMPTGEQWAGFFTDMNATQPQGRNYVTNPVVLQPAPPMIQPNVGNTEGETYKTIMVNTPFGISYQRCKLLNGQVVSCI